MPHRAYFSLISAFVFMFVCVQQYFLKNPFVMSVFPVTGGVELKIQEKRLVTET